MGGHGGRGSLLRLLATSHEATAGSQPRKRCKCNEKVPVRLFLSVVTLPAALLTCLCRAKEPWEASDGAVYMLRELSGEPVMHSGHSHVQLARIQTSRELVLFTQPQPQPWYLGLSPQLPAPLWPASDSILSDATARCAAVAPASVPEFLPALAELARLQHFAHAANLHETIWKQLPVIAENVGKKVG